MLEGWVEELSMKHPDGGFSLIELIVVIAILAVITSFAYPAYQQYLTETYMGQAAVDLKICGMALERYYSSDFTYVDADTDGICNTNSPTKGQPRYSISYESLTATGFVIRAVPVNGSCGEGDCIELDQTGHQGFN